jgi:tetratricopeptide (TPR) repeat protein
MYQRLNWAEAAIEVFRIVIQQNSDYKNYAKGSDPYDESSYRFYAAYHNLASLEYQLKRYQEALATYKKIVGLEIDSVETHYGLGLTHVALGDKQAASSEHEKMLEMLKAETLVDLRRIIEKNAKDLLEKIQKL